MDHAGTEVSTSTPSTSARRSATTSSAASSTTHHGDREPRRDRRGQHHVRDRLPALRLDVARLHRRRASAASGPPRGDQYKLLRGNAERLYRFTPAEPPVCECLTRRTVIDVDRELCMRSGMCILHAPARSRTTTRPRRRRRPHRRPDRRGPHRGPGVPDSALRLVPSDQKELSMLLEGKSAIVTGAGSGVGRASALRFAEEGARSSCADIDPDSAKETVRQIEAAGGTAVAVSATCRTRTTSIAMIAAAVEQFGRLDIMFNNVGIPTPRLGADLRGPHRRRLRSARRGEPRRRVPRLQARGAAVQGAGRRRRHPQHRLGRRPGGLGRHASTAPPRAACTSSPGRSPSRARRSASASTRSARRPCRSPDFMAAGGLEVERGRSSEQIAEHVGARHPLGRPITAEDCAEAAVYLVLGPGDQRHRRAAAGRRRVRRAMTRTDDVHCSTATGSGELFDLRSSYNAFTGRRLQRRSVPGLARLREQAPVHEGIVHELTGYEGDAVLPRPAVSRTGRTSRCSASRPATRRTATPRCSPRRRTPVDLTASRSA